MPQNAGSPLSSILPATAARTCGICRWVQSWPSLSSTGGQTRRCLKRTFSAGFLFLEVSEILASLSLPIEDTTQMLPSAQTFVLTITCVVLLGLLGCTYEVDGPRFLVRPQRPSPMRDILPLLDNHCNGCHSGGAPSAGLDLTVHSTVAESALEGSLLERLRLPATNIRMMPLGGQPLPECDIVLFESWASAGAPQN